MRPRLGLGEAMLVTAVSILIFYLAFSQTKREIELSFPVEIVTDEDDTRTRLLGTRRTQVRATLVGSAVARRDAAAAFARDRWPIRIPLGRIDPRPAGGELVVRDLDIGDGVLQPQIEQIIAATTGGITVRSVSHEPISLQLDFLETLVNRPVAVRFPDGVVVEGVEIDPPTVAMVTSRVQRTQAGEIRPTAIVDIETLQGLDGGRRHTLRRVPLRPIADRADLDLANDGLVPEILPAEVSLVFTLQLRDRQLRIPTEGGQLVGVPVHVALSPLDLDRYLLEIPERDLLLVEVDLHGPDEQIRAIEERRFQVVAHVQLGGDQLESAVLDGTPIDASVMLWTLPPGVRVTNAGVTQAQFLAREAAEPAPAGIRITVRRRPAPASAE